MIDVERRERKGSARKVEDKHSPIKIVEENKENVKSLANRLQASPGFGYKYSLRQTPIKEKPSNFRTPEKNGGNALQARNVLDLNDIGREELLSQLENEKSLNLEYRKRLTSDKTLITSLKNKVRQLEDEKAKQEESHKKSLLNIEQKIATLKNTNLQLLNKANRFDEFSKDLASLKEYKEVVTLDLK